MGATVAQAQNRAGRREHLVQRAEVAVGVAQDREVEQGLTVVLEQDVVGDLDRRRPSRWAMAATLASGAGS